MVLPTYNEAENIREMLVALLTAFDDNHTCRFSVLVVDDNSPDGTATQVLDIAAQDDRVKLLTGHKRGLGSAYTRGFMHVLNGADDKEIDVVVQMDADFSHNPDDVARLVATLPEHDVVIGSRYTSGGEVDESWGLKRRLLSRCGNLFARYVAGIYRVADCTAGFKAIRVSALRQVLPLRLPPSGYVFQVALLHALMISDARITEVPIRFSDRTRGATKLGRRDIVEFFLHVWWLRLLSRKTFVKFALTGLSGVVINLGCFQLLLSSGLNVYLSSVLAIETSIVWNFFLNNYWTFRDRQITTRKRVRGLKFNLVSLVTLAVSFGAFVVMRMAWPAQPEILAQAVSIIPGAMANYFANSYWTFKPDRV